MFKLSRIVGDVASFVMLLVCVAIVLAWTVISIAKLEMQKLSPEQVAFLLGTMGLHAYQRKNDKP